MKRAKRVLPALLIVFIPAICSGETAPDLTSRVRIDGRVTEYTPDEWILDLTTDFRESDHDSRWGANNDVWRIATTWDENYLYIAIEGSFHDSALMAFLEHAGGGIPDLISAGTIRRNIEFSSVLPNIVIQANRASPDATVAVVSILDPLRYLDRSEYTSAYFQPVWGPGALEIALPWSQVLPLAGYVKLLACVTGGGGTGSGDAAPDPTQLLSANHQALAFLDNAITVPVDANFDGQPDMGVMPRSVASFEFTQTEPVAGDGDVGLRLETNSFAPDAGEILRFKVDAAGCAVPTTVYVSGAVFSVSGERVRALFSDEARVFQEGVEPQWDQWDGRDDRGEIVRGGMFVVLITGGASAGVVSSSAKQSAAVVR
jgi:hypothetical protein